MSVIITVYTNEGIVMASDSRISYTQTQHLKNETRVISGVYVADTTYKTYLCPNSAGISTCGDASVKGSPIAGHIERMLRERIDCDTPVSDVPQIILDFFKVLDPNLNTIFHVAGYETIEGTAQPFFSIVRTAGGLVQNMIKPMDWGAAWDGETSVLSRLFNCASIRNPGANATIPVDSLHIPFDYFTLQDAVDFATYAIDTVIKTMKFCLMPDTVGYPIDVLVIKPNDAVWISKKELRTV